MKLLAALSGFWTRSSLLRRFVLAGSAVLLLNMLATGFWVSERIADGVLRQSGINSAHFVESVLAPLIQELGNADRLSRGALRALEELTAAPPLKGRVVALKIWKRGGRVVYATDTELIGRVFEPSPSLKAAWQGQVATEFDELEAPESVAEAALGLPLVEIYAPVRAVWSGEVIAVFEFYEIADALRDEIAAARRNSWLLVAGITLATGILLVGIVGAGSRTIQRQQLQLRAQIAEQQRLARANRELRLKVQRASAGAAETNERYLGRIGADLHDGPVQLLSLAALRLDAIETETDAAKRSAEIADLRQALQAAMRDIRGISRGLALPELGGKSLREVIRRAVDVHISLTRTEVALDLPATAPQLPHSQLIAVYRFVQEGLSNATRHAGGKGMRVEAEVLEDGRIRVSVCDAGPGLPETLDDSAGLGLRGLTERIESLGGDFSVENLAGGGVRIALTLDPDQESEDARR